MTSNRIHAPRASLGRLDLVAVLAAMYVGGASSGCTPARDPMRLDREADCEASSRAVWVGPPPDSDAGLSCPQSIEEFCGGGERCPGTWQDILRALGYSRFFSFRSPSIGNCGAYRLLIFPYACPYLKHLAFLYDVSGGPPIAAIQRLAGGYETCLAGPPTLAFADIRGETTRAVPKDGGALPRSCAADGASLSGAPTPP